MPRRVEPLVKHAHKVVSFPVFNNEINVVRTTNIEKSVRHFKELRGQLPNDYDFKDLHGLTVLTSVSGIWVFLPIKNTPETDAHEAYHAIRHLLEYAGVKLQSEVVAYHLGHLVGAMQLTPKEYTRIKRKK